MKPESVIKFSYIMIVAYLIAAIKLYDSDDSEHTVMFLVGIVFWIANIFIWSRVRKDEGVV